MATVLFDAMGQGVSARYPSAWAALAILGSYMEKDKRILGEAINITALDTFVAVMAGLIIFRPVRLPACRSDAGPSLIFVTLPNIFNTIPLGQLWGGLFFLFMLFAALSTLVAVFENILSFGMDLWGWSRKKACLINLIAILVLSLPALLGSNVWSGVQILGMSITDFEDFLVSNNILPIGSIVYVLFCVSKRGWGWKNFLQEANTGEGMKFPNIRIYMKYVIPIVVLYIFIQGYIGKFFM